MNSSLLGIWRMQHRMDLALILKALSPSLRPSFTRCTTSSGLRSPLGNTNMQWVMPNITAATEKSPNKTTRTKTIGYMFPKKQSNHKQSEPKHLDHPPGGRLQYTVGHKPLPLHVSRWANLAHQRDFPKKCCYRFDYFLSHWYVFKCSFKVSS